jgi:hypothetical protein
MKAISILGVVVTLIASPAWLAGLIGAPHYGPWSTPVNLGAPINTAFNETAPTLSKDGRSLYFSSNRPCGLSDTTLDPNVWVAQRDGADGAWGAPECLQINVDGFEDSAPAFSRDGHWMFFVSDRPGSNARDIGVSWRSHVHDDQGWGEPFNAGSVINTPFVDAGPSYFENESGFPQLFFTSNRNGTFDIWVSDVLGGGLFDAPRLVDELSTDSFNEARPFIRHDGLEFFFFGGVNVNKIFSATRSDPTAPWSEPLILSEPVNSAFNDQQASISADRKTLLFVSNRSGGLGNFDIWLTTREQFEAAE